MKTRVLIADDHELFAEGLRYILENLSDDLSIVGIAENGKEALEMAGREAIDVVLMDVRMPVIDGVESARLFRLFHPDVEIIMLTTFDDDEYVHRAIQHGASGYLLKSIRPTDLLSAIKSVMAGQLLFDGKLRSLADFGQSGKNENDILIAKLTPREREVLEHILESRSNRQIGNELGISDHSVRNYVSNIYLAFNVNDRFELIQKFKDKNGPNGPD